MNDRPTADGDGQGVTAPAHAWSVGATLLSSMAQMTRQLYAGTLLSLLAACAPLTDGSAGLTAPMPLARERVATHAHDPHCTRNTGPERHPLFVVDGVPFGRNADGTIDQAAIDRVFSTLTPKDIENIEVVKPGAAMTAYGIRGQDGVVVIRTKRKPAAS